MSKLLMNNDLMLNDLMLKEVIFLLDHFILKLYLILKERMVCGMESHYSKTDDYMGILKLNQQIKTFD